MSAPANTTRKIAPDRLCREETCERLDLHESGPQECIKRRGRERTYSTRSRKYGHEPWRAYNADAMREAALNATSRVEPRNFSMILRFVEDDYGSCCRRSLHRHLDDLRDDGEIVRMDFRGRIHAYLRAGSRLLAEPDLVFEQILDLHAERSGFWAPSVKRGFAKPQRDYDGLIAA